jgi:4-hydroxy-tetrahydrodipicolinate synthase
MLYNVPSRTGVKMNFNAIKSLNGHKNFWAIKEASGLIGDFIEYANAAPLVKMYSGDDGMLFDFIPHRCVGLVSVASNCWPLETHAYVVKALLGKLSKSEAELWSKACDTLFISANPIPVKCLMKFQGRISSNTLRAPLNHLDLQDLSPLEHANKTILNWYKENV